ncbi:outer membrane beta-barrel protein [Enterovibrio nigricans]|uniref:OmpA-OmpF porin, OOP family n=1 Tax=Enterovibrio nigricans DSM 22720 TaxID=1121868 RepID=A0A1T4VAZ2_9GAMM|nr:outer membrane beta-barrel protein [Enterovibrio nigricans]SKA61681.1 OmpA-OmpF porin, OOP family [Enterovibrio nigricans DSM 22720]
MSVKKTKLSSFISTTLFLTLVSNVAAADVYVGAKYGWNDTNKDCKSDSRCEDDGQVGGIFTGYEINEHVGLELEADYLGQMKSYHNGKLSDTLYAISLTPKFNLPMTENINLFTKLGGAYVNFDGNQEDYVFTGAVGAEYTVNYNWKIRGEYQRFENIDTRMLRSVDANVFTVGVQYKFGSPEPVYVTKTIQVTDVVEGTELVTYTHPVVLKTVQFGFDSTMMNDSTILRETVKVLNAYPEAKANVTGFTDNTGPETVNRLLSERRALAVAEYLEQAGVSSGRLMIEGKGDIDPVADNETAKGRELNRRAVVEVPSFEYQVEETVVKEVVRDVTVTEEVIAE